MTRSVTTRAPRHAASRLVLGVFVAGALVAMFGTVTASSRADESARDPHASLIEAQIAYLQHLANARQKMTAGDPDAAVLEIEKALALELPDTLLPSELLPALDLATSHAAAHYEMACARAMQGDVDAAKRRLRQAAKNGFRDTALVIRDPRLARVQSPEGFSKIVERFPAENPTDSHAGKTVEDPRFGMSLLGARKGNFPKLGERAPDFELPRLATAKSGDTANENASSGETLRLSSMIGEKPIVLVFGSFT